MTDDRPPPPGTAGAGGTAEPSGTAGAGETAEPSEAAGAGETAEPGGAAGAGGSGAAAASGPTDEPSPQPPGAGTSGPAPGPGAGPAGPGAGPGVAEPPPLTAFAWRYGLVRPSQGRLLAGVCGAFGRATNTDPILWRVVIAVLTIFGGIGALVYLIAWLVLPADGDTASPVEALAGRGRSGSSTVLTIIGGIIVVFALAAYISEPFRATPLVAAFLLGGVLLLLLRDQQRGRARPAGATPGYPATGAGHAAAPMGVPSAYPPAAGPTYAAPSAPYPPPAPSGASTLPPFGPPPFAPHGPFVTPPPPLPPLPPVIRPPEPPKPKSRLGGLMFSIILLALGALAAVNLAGYHVPPSAFLATALGLVGVGLLIGAWFGRARGLIVLGILLAMVLSGGLVADWDNGWRNGWWRDAGTATWAPVSVEAVQREYRQGIGDATLDLSGVDFSESDIITVDVQIDLGSLRVIVPSDVDVTVKAQVDVGDADVFAEHWDGMGQSARTITDLGDDGPGGGRLNINAKVDVGELRVTR